MTNETIGQKLERTAQNFPSETAVKYVDMPYKCTWYELNQNSHATARGLLGMGIKKGDHVAIWATNYPQWIELFFATARIGAVLVPLNTHYKENELGYALKQSDTKALFICNKLKDIDCQMTMHTLCPELKTHEIGALRSRAFPRLKWICNLDGEYENMYNWEDIAHFGKTITDAQYKKAMEMVECDDIINLQYTSGTTGHPKGVLLTHRGIVNNSQSIADGMKLTNMDKMVIPVPFHHCFGMVLSIMACVSNGTAMLPLEFFTPMKVLHAAHFEKATAINGTPSNFEAILNHRDFNKYSKDTLRTGIIAGALPPEVVVERMINEMNLTQTVSVYGLTEASPGCTMTTVDDTKERRTQTVGRPFEGVEVKIINEKGETLGPNQDGEVCARGYNIMKGYYKDKKATDKAIDAEGWLHTGDKGSMDEFGYQKITGRIKDMIIYGGENISPAEIEECYLKHEDVASVAVIGVPDEKYGEVVCAIIKPKVWREFNDEDRAAFRKYIEDRLAKFKVPKYIHFMGELPLTSSGKVKKQFLRDTVPEQIGIRGMLSRSFSTNGGKGKEGITPE